MNLKQQMIKALKHSIEKTEADIVEYSKPCEKSVAQNRTAHREYLKKQLKKMKKQLKKMKKQLKELEE